MSLSLERLSVISQNANSSTEPKRFYVFDVDDTIVVPKKPAGVTFLPEGARPKDYFKAKDGALELIHEVKRMGFTPMIFTRSPGPGKKDTFDFNGEHCAADQLTPKLEAAGLTHLLLDAEKYTIDRREDKRYGGKADLAAMIATDLHKRTNGEFVAYFQDDSAFEMEGLVKLRADARLNEQIPQLRKKINFVAVPAGTPESAAQTARMVWEKHNKTDHDLCYPHQCQEAHQEQKEHIACPKDEDGKCAKKLESGLVSSEAIGEFAQNAIRSKERSFKELEKSVEKQDYVFKDNFEVIKNLSLILSGSLQER
jgi:hypothetical protein